MGKNRYVGHRYIPIFENGWDKTRTYEPLTFVYYEGKTYVSRQLVPTNIEITDNDFWAFFMDNAPVIFTPTFMGQWEDKSYEPLTIVVNNGDTYVSRQGVPVGTLLNDETYWLDLSTYYTQLFTDYENSEQERQQAEVIRVENENQRKIDHANRSAEFEGKADKVVINNLVENGGFSDELNSWENYGSANANSTITVCENPISSDGYCVKIYRDDDQTGGFGLRKSFSFDKSSKLYIKVETLRLSSDGLTSVSPSFTTENPFSENYSRNVIYDTWQYLSTVLDKTSIDKPFYINLAPAINSSGLTTYFKEVMIINLTEVFGAGNEPTKEEMDKLIETTGYIDEEYALNNKEMLIWTLALIRRNKNAIISLGGTI